MPVVKYSVLRLGLFALCLVLLLWAGMGSWLAVVVAAFGAWGLSYVLLAGPRDGAAIWLAERAAARGDRPRLSRRAQEDAEFEDAAVDAEDAVAEDIGTKNADAENVATEGTVADSDTGDAAQSPDSATR